ncbi:Pro-Pol polyprotein [Stylophora pistillata]|uniref:Pro-Pol polyprotein n=1 Tax=Stylophora pistillata TaxID=50429 RepID=A0A2B4SIX4_STYPI|nr:Pro-Pol polyprotein [Stylophora pistillata]
MLGKLREVSGNVRAMSEKLKGIKGDLVREHEDWRDWDFAKLFQAIKSWRDINSEGEESDGASVSKRKNDRNDWNARVPPPRGKSYQVQQQASGRQMRGCVYCDDTNHTSVNCTKVVAVGDRKRILSQKQLCFNCTSDKHRADSYRSRGCHNFQRRHHTPLCDHPPSGHTTRGRFMTAQNKGTERVVYPVVDGEVNGIKCSALLDTGAGSSYASSAILEHLGSKPQGEGFKRIEIMLGSTNKVIGVHSVTIGSIDGKFRLETEVTRVDRSTLLSLGNAGYAEILEKYPYLDGVYMDDRDEKPELPVHIILGASEYAKIKTETIPKIGRSGEPVAEPTKFGWTIMSPGKDVDLANMFLTLTTAADYERLSRLDVLGLRDTPSGDQADVYEEVKEQLTRGPEGWYEMGLPWELSELLREIEKSLYVDDLISGGPTVKAAREVKAGVTHVFDQALLKLHKWHSNVPAVKSPEYGVISQPSGDSVGLIAAKARLAKQGLTIPHLELVSGHMATNLIVNVKEALDGFPVGNMFCWLDSSVALHWIKGAASYKQFVSNRVQNIQQNPEVNWRHVGTKDNPGDLRSRSGGVENQELCWRGPEWLLERERWPADIKTTATPDSQAEANVIREVFAVAQAKTDILDALLVKFNLWKTLRVCAWVTRFMHNLRSEKTRRSKGPLTTKEIEMQRHLWLKRAQVNLKREERFEDHCVHLNLQENANGLLEFQGRIQGDYPIYLPEFHPFAEKMVADAHIRTLHGGVSLTMAKIRERYWVRWLRRLAKRVVKACNGCKRFRATAFAATPPGQPPRDRTEGKTAFQVVRVDFAGPLKYRKGRNQEGKVYIALYACSLTRGIYLELPSSLEKGEFLRFTARRGRPENIYSDNGSTFVAEAKWLKQVMTDERLNEFLSRQEIKWQFNLSRAPWWGGQFERMVGLVKRSLQKTTRNGFLTWTELEEAILDVEVAVNNRPLNYVEDDVQLPILTPTPYCLVNQMHFSSWNHTAYKTVNYASEQSISDDARRPSGDDGRGIRKGAARTPSSKESWKTHNPSVDEVLLIKSDDKNRGKWKVGIVTELIKSRDGVVRGARLRTGTSHLERTVQQLYLLELSCDRP